MEQAARRSHEITLIGDIQGRKQTNICHRGGNSRGKARRLTPTDFNDLVATGSQLSLQSTI